MCQAQAQGGLRCAAHTRPAWEAATFGTPEWDQAAAEYAATPSGKERFIILADDAEEAGDFERMAALRAAMRRGHAMRQSALAVPSALARARDRSQKQAAVLASLRAVRPDAEFRVMPNWDNVGEVNVTTPSGETFDFRYNFQEDGFRLQFPGNRGNVWSQSRYGQLLMSASDAGSNIHCSFDDTEDLRRVHEIISDMCDNPKVRYPDNGLAIEEDRWADFADRWDTWGVPDEELMDQAAGRAHEVLRLAHGSTTWTGYPVETGDGPAKVKALEEAASEWRQRRVYDADASADLMQKTKAVLDSMLRARDPDWAPTLRR